MVEATQEAVVMVPALVAEATGGAQEVPALQTKVEGAVALKQEIQEVTAVPESLLSSISTNNKKTRVIAGFVV